MSEFILPPPMREVRAPDADMDAPIDRPSVTGAARYVRNYGTSATGNTKQTTGASITAGTATLTTIRSEFSAADVGKIILVAGAGIDGATLDTRIIGYTSGTQLTLAADATTTVAGASILWGGSPTGQDDTAAISAAIAATPAGGVCVLDDADSQGTYMVSQSILSYGANPAIPKPVKLMGLSTRDDIGIVIYARPAIGDRPMISANTRYAPGGTATQYSFGELANFQVNLTFNPSGSGIYYDRVQKIRETDVAVRGGACGRVIGWVNDLRAVQPKSYNQSDSCWKWLHSYSSDAPWDTFNAGNTIGPGGTYRDPVQYELIYPFNYLTNAFGSATANAFYTIRAGNDFQILGGHSLRAPGLPGYIRDGLNADFSAFPEAKKLFLFTDFHQIDGAYDKLGAGAGVSLTNAQVATFGDNFWCSAAPAADAAAMWALKLTNCTDVTVGAGHWNGLGVLLDGVNAQLNFAEPRFPQSLGGYVFNSRAAGTLDASMNGLALPKPSIAVESMVGTIPSSGRLMIATSNGPQAVFYTGQSTIGSVTTFSGCTGGMGTMSTGGTVVLQTATSSRFSVRYYAGSLTDTPETWAGLVQASPAQARGPMILSGNATIAALQIMRTMDAKAWSLRMDTSAAGSLVFLNAEGATRMAISDSGALSRISTISVTGQKGATAASGWGGGTTGGAPVSGTFTAGQFVVDQTGKIWVCTAAGSPGTWVSVGESSPGNAAGTQYKRTSADAIPDAVADTYGPAVTLSANTGYSGFAPFGMYVTSTGLSSETVTYMVTPTHNTGPGPAVSANVTANTTGEEVGTLFSAAVFKDGSYLKSLSFQVKSSIANSVASLTLAVHGVSTG